MEQKCIGRTKGIVHDFLIFQPNIEFANKMKEIGFEVEIHLFHTTVAIEKNVNISKHRILIHQEEYNYPIFIVFNEEVNYVFIFSGYDYFMKHYKII